MSEPLVDVVKVMDEIRAAIRRKREAGYYSDEEVEDLATLRARSWGEAAGIDAALLGQLLHPSHDWNVAPAYKVESHRGGAGGALSVALKKVVSPFVRLYTDHVTSRQAQINLYFFHVLKNALLEQTRLQFEVRALRAQLAARDSPPPPRP
jgi:hypothetical protein